jgi:hypothetical protein
VARTAVAPLRAHGMTLAPWPWPRQDRPSRPGPWLISWSRCRRPSPRTAASSACCAAAGGVETTLTPSEESRWWRGRTARANRALALLAGCPGLLVGRPFMASLFTESEAPRAHRRRALRSPTSRRSSPRSSPHAAPCRAPSEHGDGGRRVMVEDDRPAGAGGPLIQNEKMAAVGQLAAGLPRAEQPVTLITGSPSAARAGAGARQARICR